MFPSAKTIGRIAFRRRLLLGLTTALLLLVAAVPLFRTLNKLGWSVYAVFFYVLFLILFAQVCFTFAVTSAGWWILRGRRVPIRITNDEAEAMASQAELPPTAMVMPIHNEEVNRVFQGLRTMYLSLQKEPGSAAFDFFILSDTTDANAWIAEEQAWMELCKEVNGFGRIFYRKRRVQLHNKSGNIADFCRRWGTTYRYMVVLDADSMMTGGALVALARLMEKHPEAGIIQSTTYPVYGETLFQRIEQFSAFAFRHVFTEGANFWQLRDASFWGHNAIIRLKPFMEYCAMPELPEVGPLGRRVMSHDTIESALMRRGGFEVWQACDLPGSYEESPPHLLASLQRDRRWCHGNMQHFWFLFERGLKWVSRFNILNGILAYANSPLWLFSLILGTLFIFQEPSGAGHFSPRILLISFGLYFYTMALLLMPKIYGSWLTYRSSEYLKACGGRGKLFFSFALETVYSTLLGPVLMLFHTRFVCASFSGSKVKWSSQVRSDGEGPAWRSWLALHGVNTIVALLVTVALLWLKPWLALWLAPVLLGPILAIPLSRLSASRRLGRRAREAKLFLTPEEIALPPEMALDESPIIRAPQAYFQSEEYARDYGLLQAVLDPYVNAIHVSMLRQRKESSTRTRVYMGTLASRLLAEGPSALSDAEKKTLLWDADAMLAMHEELWSSPAACLHTWWQDAFRHYVEASAISERRGMAA